MNGRLSDHWQDRFDLDATVAGAALFRAGAVKLRSGASGGSHGTGAATRWTARVRDGRRWDCHLDGTVAGCSCLQRREQGPCAHLWAMFLAIDAVPPAEAIPDAEAAPDGDPGPDRDPGPDAEVHADADGASVDAGERLPVAE
ncbi:MAG: hypothetical protein ABMB14_30065 [Myxococcota bacterium]